MEEGGKGPGGTEAGGGSVKGRGGKMSKLEQLSKLHYCAEREKRKKDKLNGRGFPLFSSSPLFFSRCRRGISDCAERKGLWAWRGENPTADIFICSPLKAVLVGALPQRGGELVG